MPVFDWNVYANRLRDKGYDIELVRDKTGQAKVHGYRFTFGRTTIKASELGVGRNLTASKIENTFRSKTFCLAITTKFLGQQKYGNLKWSVTLK